MNSLPIYYIPENGVYIYCAGQGQTKNLVPTHKCSLGEGKSGVVFPHKLCGNVVVKKSKNLFQCEDQSQITQLIQTRFLGDFSHEYIVGRKLSHPCFVKMINIFFKCYPNGFVKNKLVMERVLGKTISEITQEDMLRLGTPKIYSLFAQLKEATLYLYSQKIGWQDLHQHNVFITNDGKLKFIDYTWDIYSDKNGKWYSPEGQASCANSLIEEGRLLMRTILGISEFANYKFDEITKVITSPPSYGPKRIEAKIDDAESDFEHCQLISNFYDNVLQQLIFSGRALHSNVPMVYKPNITSLGTVYPHASYELLVIVSDDADVLFSVGSHFKHPNLMHLKELKIVKKLENNDQTFAVILDAFDFTPLEKRKKISRDEIVEFIKEAKDCCLYLYEYEWVWQNLTGENIFIDDFHTQLVLGNYRNWTREEDPYTRSEKLIMHATELVQSLLKRSALSHLPATEFRQMIFPDTFRSVQEKPLIVSSSNKFAQEWVENFIANTSYEFEELISDYFDTVIDNIESFIYRQSAFEVHSLLRKQIIDKKIIADIVDYYGSKEEWQSLENFILSCMQMPLQTQVYSQLNEIFFKCVSEYAELPKNGLNSLNDWQDCFHNLKNSYEMLTEDN